MEPVEEVREVEEDEAFAELENELLSATEEEEKPAEEKPEEEKPVEQKTQDEEKALRGGWKPKDQFVADGGDPDDWVSARRFNIDGKKMAKLRELETRLETYDKRTRDVIRHAQEAAEQKAQAAIQAARDEKWKAMEDGDIDAARLAEAREEQLRQHLPRQEVDNSSLWAKVEEKHADARAISVTPDFQFWLTEQPIAVQQAYQHSDNPEHGIQIFSRYKEQRRQNTDDLWGEAPRQARKPPPVSEPRRVQTRKRETGYSDLSNEAKSTFLEFVRLEMVKDTKEAREEYAKECALRGET